MFIFFDTPIFFGEFGAVFVFLDVERLGVVGVPGLEFRFAYANVFFATVIGIGGFDFRFVNNALGKTISIHGT